MAAFALAELDGGVNVYESTLAAIGREVDAKLTTAAEETAQAAAAAAEAAAARDALAVSLQTAQDALQAALRAAADAGAPVPVPPVNTAQCGTRTLPAPLRVIRPATAAEFQRWIGGEAQPGDQIDIRGCDWSVYTFRHYAAGTQEHPVVVLGDAGTILTRIDGKGSALNIEAANVIYDGVTVRNGTKNVWVRASGVRLWRCDIGYSGDEAVHIENRASGTDLFDCVIHHTGLKQPQYGEGVYIGQHPGNGPVKPFDPVSGTTIEQCRFHTLTGAHVKSAEGSAGLVMIGTVHMLNAQRDPHGVDDVVGEFKGTGTLCIRARVFMPDDNLQRQTPIPYVFAVLGSAKPDVWAGPNTTAIWDAVITGPKPNGATIVRPLTGTVEPYAVSLNGSSWNDAV